MGRSLLHDGCFEDPVIPIGLIHLYLDAGANPNSIDVDVLTPLDSLSNNINAVNISAALKLFLDSGVHLDKVGVGGVTVGVWCNRTLTSNSQLLLSRTPSQTCSLTLSKTLP